MGSVELFLFFYLVRATCLVALTGVGVKVERPQRSEDERP